MPESPPSSCGGGASICTVAVVLSSAVGTVLDGGGGDGCRAVGMAPPSIDCSSSAYSCCMDSSYVWVASRRCPRLLPSAEMEIEFERIIVFHIDLTIFMYCDCKFLF